jgi:hypothetical protein
MMRKWAIWRGSNWRFHKPLWRRTRFPAPEIMAQVDWGQAKLQAIPALAILPLRSNAGEIWVALADGAPPPAAQRDEAQHRC